MKEIKVAVGDKTETGKLIMIFEAAGAAEAAPAAKAEENRRQLLPRLPLRPKTLPCRTSAPTKSK